MRRLVGAMMLTLFLMGTVTCFAALPNMQNISKPNPEPSAQSGWDIFAPPVTTASAVSGTPIIAEWTRVGAPDDTLAITGDVLSGYTGSDEGKDSRFLLYGQTTLGNGVEASASVQRIDGLKAAITLPSALPAWSTYLLWPGNTSGYGYPVAVNRTEAWWIGPDDKVTRGDTVSVYGRNLSHDNGTTSSWVYVKPAGSAGYWATVTSVNPYRVQFTVPASCSNGTYEVWVHNGHGGSYGWSGPLTLVVTNGYTWNGSTFDVTSYGANGSDQVDDTTAFNAAWTAAWNYRGANPGYCPTIYIPSGTYLISSSLGIATDTRWLGAGIDQTVIKANASLTYGLFGSNGGTAVNSEVKDLTLDGNGNIPASQGSLVWLQNNPGAADLRFTNVRFWNLSSVSNNLKLVNTARACFTGCEFVGGHAYLLVTRQIQFKDCDFWGANDTMGFVYAWATNEISMTGCTAQDYDINSSTGQCLGRLFFGAGIYGSERNIYVADCVTTDYGPRSGASDENTGEQIACEGNNVSYEGSPASATSTTVTFSDLSTSYVNETATILNGKGLGQYRKITAFDSGSKTITVSPAWNVIPDTTSRIVIGGVASKWIAYNNQLDGKNDYATRNRGVGIIPYGGCHDWVCANNTITNEGCGGIFLVAMQQTTPIYSVGPSYFNYFLNNSIQYCYRGGMNNSGIPGTTPYGPGLLGNMWRNNQFSNITTTGLYEYGSTPGTTGNRLDLNVYEHNTLTNLPKAFDCDESNAGTRSRNTMLYKNSASLGTATYSGSFAVDFGSNGALPGLRTNTWTGFQTTYSGSTPGAILEVPTRKFEVMGTTGGSSQTASLTIWNSGTSSLSWTATSDQTWLTLSAGSGSVANENSSSSVTLTCNPASLAAGTYTGTVTITGASQTKKVIVTFFVNPSMPSGSMKLWLKADTGVTKDGSNMVSAWADQSGSGNDVTPYWTYQTEYIASAMNGRPALYFDGSCDNLRKVLSTPLAGTFTYFAVCSSPYTQVKQNQGGVNNRVMDFNVVGTPNSFFQLTNDCSTPFEPAVKIGATVLNQSQSVAVMGLGTMFNSDGTCGGDFAYTGYISEVIVYNRALTTQEVTDVTTYLANKYAITANAAPTCSITAPTGGFSYAAPYTLNITASASDSNGTISRVEFYNNGLLLGTDTSSAGGWTCSWSNVEASGSSGISLVAKAYDNLGATALSSVVTGTITDSALKCYWKLDETSGTSAADSSGTGNTGATYNSPTWGACKIANGLSLNGTNQYAADTSATLFAANANQTLSFWMYVPTNPTVRKTALCLTSTSGNGTYVGFLTSTTFGVWRYSNTAVVTTTTLPSAGNWHHIAYVLNGTNKYLYIDGSQAATSTTSPNTYTSTRIHVGRTAAGGDYWPGKVDEVRAYNRVLTLAEIQSLAAAKQ